MKNGGPFLSSVGNIWVSGDAFYSCAGVHNQNLVTCGQSILPPDVSIVGKSYAVQGFCGDSAPGSKGRTSNAINQWIGL